jgi:hypothetical protein
MDNKKKILIIFIFIMVLLGLYPRLEIQAIQTAPTNKDCVERDKWYPNYQCVGPVVSWTPTITSCLDGCNSNPGVCGFYVYSLSENFTCQSAYSTQTGKCTMDCMYGGLPVYSCSDSDGLNFYNKGTTTNYYGFSMEDSCSSSSLLTEYYCENNKITNMGISCGCVNGACDDNSACTVPADTSPCDGIVSRDELGKAISYWISGLMSRTDLGITIQNWVTNG